MSAGDAESTAMMAVPTAQSSLRLDYAAITDVGPVRKDNQDSGYAGPHLLDDPLVS